MLEFTAPIPLPDPPMSDEEAMRHQKFHKKMEMFIFVLWALIINPLLGGFVLLCKPVGETATFAMLGWVVIIMSGLFLHLHFEMQRYFKVRGWEP